MKLKDREVAKTLRVRDDISLVTLNKNIHFRNSCIGSALLSCIGLNNHAYWFVFFALFVLEVLSIRLKIYGQDFLDIL